MTALEILMFCLLGGIMLRWFRPAPCDPIKVTFRNETLRLVLRCKSHLNSRIGLMNTPRLEAGDGLLLVGVKSIHTVSMTYPIDVVFLDDMTRVLAMHRGLQPGQKKLRGPYGTLHTLELGAGTLATLLPHLQIYDQLVIENIKVQST